MISRPPETKTNVPLALGTLSFAVCFAAWGLIAAFAPRFRDTLSSFRHAGRSAGSGASVAWFSRQASCRHAGGPFWRRGSSSPILMLCAASRRCLTPMAHTYQQLLVGGFFLGLAGSSFAVGVGFVSRWFTAGTARRRARHLWPRQYRPVGGRIPRAAARALARLAERLSRHGRPAGRMGGRLLAVRAQRARNGAGQRVSARCWRCLRASASPGHCPPFIS